MIGLRIVAPGDRSQRTLELLRGSALYLQRRYYLVRRGRRLHSPERRAAGLPDEVRRRRAPVGAAPHDRGE